MPYQLPPLPYPTNALEPHIDARTMEIHHDKHHAAYVTNLNKAIENTEWDNRPIEELMRNIDKDKLGVALKGANETVRQFFFTNMSSRAAKMLVEDMQAMGPVRLRDVDEAQALLVNIAKDLAAKGEILISKSRGEDELIY